MKVRLLNTNGRFGQHATGYIQDEATYESVKNGELDWSDLNKAKITHYTIPASVFERLLELDRNNKKL